uniref:SCP domain-containing protein n=1 Tax=Strongyloides papillosus TaxID=174720 RepID=A0A0N5BHQ7_STREA
MYNLNSNYCVITITLSILFSQYHALEKNVKNDDSALLNFIQNDLSSKNFINQDSLIYSISESKYLRKRQADEKKGQKKSVVKKITKTKVPPKKPTHYRPTTKNPLVGKPQSSKPLPGKPPLNKPQTRKPSPGRPSRGPIRLTSRLVTRTPSKTTAKRSITLPKKTVTPPKRPTTTQTISKKLPPSKIVTSTQKTPTTVTTKPSSISAFTSTLASTSTSKPRPQIHLGKYTKEKLDLIEKINKERRLFQANDLTVDPELSKRAQKLTEESTEKERNVINPYKDVGMLTFYSNDDDHDYGFSQWISDFYDIKFDDPDNISHHHNNFTQIIWRGSKKIGCGINKDVNLDLSPITVVACLFSPKGNIPGNYSQNIRHIIYLDN